MEISGFGYQRPWVLNSDSSSVIAVENEHMLEYYRNEGIQEEQLVVTGAIYDDVLTRATLNKISLRKELYHKLDLTEGQRLLLCALPPNQFPRTCEFGDYTSMITCWMQDLASVQGWNVVVRPHPRQTQNEIALLAGFGVKVTTLDTASLVPLCDLYVASVSATIRWAIACGKPVINYDVYQMKYNDYSEVKGVLTVHKREDFTYILNRLTTDSEYFGDVQRVQQADSQFWGILDGRSSERILKLLDDIIAGKHKEKNK
jgi:UDP-N-acetylglucosamine 2-epimerase